MRPKTAQEPSTIALSAIRTERETFATPIAGLRTPLSRMIEILKARSEGMGLNADGVTNSLKSLTGCGVTGCKGVGFRSGA
ncbi:MULTISPECIES: hypothetical protein [Moorena]|uniref:Uncharacterized protein n=1 Tax=Moorena producens 3L TaxID=489825 RepID=F4XZ16_9CYAN|nr:MULTISPECIES: hypothetical protein [Moorena]EGJ30168.1 hypothetical protein LYNGBM3L_53750 [Moorena producens 3L]NEP33338.1 hypothetical protein [Moorena sp. SIO3B2]NEQ06145.1 hypothetical protein [Moorena sp. SIO4E2]NER89466.1 hypothetical protein [Moorena sp. SIO3A2]NET69468.1 hypothetical protein [Moorena sp. SIO1G6]